MTDTIFIATWTDQFGDHHTAKSEVDLATALTYSPLADNILEIECDDYIVLVVHKIKNC